MKCRHITLIFFILFNPYAYAKSLDAQDKQAVHKLVKTLTTKLFLLETTEYNSTSLQKELLAIMPDQIAVEGEYRPISKQVYIDGGIRLALDRKRREIQKIIQNNVTPVCQYIEDDTIDCDFLEKIKIIEKADVMPQQPLSYSTGTEYKFNLKMDESGEWYINKMKTWNMIPAPPISTLMVEKEHRKKLKKERRSKLNSPVENEDNLDLPTAR